MENTTIPVPRADLERWIEAMEKARRYQICDEIDKVLLPSLKEMREMVK